MPHQSVPSRVLCVCIGNGDRSPVMQAVLGMFLDNAGFVVQVDSAGIEKSAIRGCVAEFGVFAAKRIGLDIAGQLRRHITDVDLESYDLIVTASDDIAGVLMKDYNVPTSKMHNAAVTNPWVLHHQERYDEMTMPGILVEMYNVVRFYFPRPV